MSKNDPYFQFPLCLLAESTSTESLIQDASALSMLTFGESMDENARRQVADEYEVEVPEDDDCQAIAAGAARLGVQLGSIESIATHARALRDRLGDGGMLVRLRTDIAWSAHDTSWPLMKIKTLCGVYAGIGNRDAQRINHRLLRAYCAGYASPKGLDEQQLVPTSTLRYWLEQLWFQNLYQFCLYGQERWYSKSCKDDQELARLVTKRRQVKKQKTVIQTKED